jgi:hypothetical protein
MIYREKQRIKSTRMRSLITLCALTFGFCTVFAQSPKPLVTPQTPTVLAPNTSAEMRNMTLATPPQDIGLPYTRSAKKRAIDALKTTHALFVGSRYAYIFGYKVRLDTADILRSEAIFQDGQLFVPVAYAPLMALKSVQPKPIPKGLEILNERWVYDIERKMMAEDPSVKTVKIKGVSYFSATEYAKSLGFQVKQFDNGLLLFSEKPINYQNDDAVLADCIISLFDTPEKFMNPDIATQYIPTLKKQGKFTEHARVTPEQLKLLEQPEPEWGETPRNTYDFTGFNAALLGSKTPKAGVYPRLLFSPEDIPMLQKHVKTNKSAMKSMIEIEILFQKTWWDPLSSDGKIFDMLASDNLTGNEKVNNGFGAAAYHVAALTKDHKPGIFNTHINYVSNCLTTMALYCLLTDNAVLGKKVANAITTYYKLVDAKVDEHVKMSDSEFGTTPDGANSSETQWRGMHTVVPHMDLAFSLDFAGKYMTSEQLKMMQNLIAKATYGRRANGGDGPRRAWRDINHLTWHLTHHISLAAIEGLDGFDAEGYASGCELTRDFLEWGIDINGQMFESNGKSGGGFQFQFLAMLVQARRGDNLFGHPHLRKMLTAQVFTTSPNRKETVSSGTWGGSPLVVQTVSQLKAFFPNDKAADYLLQAQMPDLDLNTFDPEMHRKTLEKDIKNVRLPSPTYPGFGLGFPYIMDWQPTSRADLNLPLDWQTDVHGNFSTSSDKTDNATWLSLHTRANTYIGSGHHHADIGLFYFSGLGVNWFTESPFPKTYSGKYHNEIIIDGKAEAEGPPAAGKYLGANMTKNGAFATVDQTYAYTWQWCTQAFEWGTGFTKIDSTVAKNGWELEPNPEIIKYFQGTQRYKMRFWWATANFANWIPTLRALWNPVEYVYRTTGLVRGNHPYGIIVDDAKKDDKQRQYEWTVMLAKGVWKAEYPLSIGGIDGATVLGYDKNLEKTWAKPKEEPALKPQKGDPMLLVFDLEKNKSSVKTATDGPDNVGGNFIDGKGAQPYNKLIINRKDSEAHYKVLLIPFRFGEALPIISFKNSTATIVWKDQTDTLIFKTQPDKRSHVTVKREGQVIGESK